MQLLSNFILISLAITYGIFLLLFLANKTNWKQSSNKKARIGFSVFLGIVFLWTCGQIAFVNWPLNRSLTLGTFAIASLIPGSFLWFCSSFFSWKRLSFAWIFTRVFYAISAIIFVLSLIPDFLFTSIKILPNGQGFVELASGYTWYSLAILASVLFLGVILTREYHAAKNPITKKQILYILLGFESSFLLMVLFGLIFPAIFKEEDWGWISPLFFLIAVFITIYSAYCYRFIDMRLSLSRRMKYILATIFGLAGSITFHILIEHTIASDLLEVFSTIIVFLGIYQGSLLLLSRIPFHHLFGYHDFRRYQNTLLSFGKKVSLAHTLSEIKFHIQKTFCEILHIHSAHILLKEKKRSEYPFLERYFLKNNTPLVRTEVMLKMKHDELLPSCKEEFDQLKGEVIFPLLSASENKILGFFILGEKPMQSLYSTLEIQLLSDTIPFLSLALTHICYHDELVSKTKELKQSHEALKKYDQEKDEFVATASHELRTPLTVIRGYSAILLQKEKSGVEQKKYLKRILMNSEDLLKTIDQMLDPDCREKNDFPLQYEHFSAGDLIQEVIEDLLPQSQKVNISIKQEGEEGKCPLVSDRGRLKQVFLNLANNAFRYSNEGEVIYLAFQCRGNEVLFWIRDTGVGINSDEQEKIFQKFYQIKEKNIAKKNRGLGLSLCKDIIETLGGEIGVKSQKGEGSTFFFTLPKEGRIQCG